MTTAAICLSLCGEAKAAELRPVIVSEWASAITPTSATLEAKIAPGHWVGQVPGEGEYDPEFDSGALYQFQLVTDPSEFRPEASCPERHPAAPLIGCIGSYGWERYGGEPPAGSIEREPGGLPTTFIDGEAEVQSVSLDLAEAQRTLDSGVTYHYRVLVVPRLPTMDLLEWEAPPVYGADQVFTTPLTESEPVEEPRGGDAVGNAQDVSDGHGGEALAGSPSTALRPPPALRPPLLRRECRRRSLRKSRQGNTRRGLQRHRDARRRCRWLRVADEAPTTYTDLLRPGPRTGTQKR